MPTYTEISLDQGTDFNNILTLTDDNTGLPMNVANYTITANAKTSYISPNVSFSFALVVNDAPNGNVSLSLSAGTSANVQPKTYVFDVKSKSAANVTSRLLYGLCEVFPGVT